MYESHYNLAEKPFMINTDPKFLWLGEKYKEALAVLKYGVASHNGLLLLTGEVGTGKTTLINALLESLDEDTIVANVTNPKLELVGFFNLISTLFNIPRVFDCKEDFIIHFSSFLQKSHSNNKNFLLIIDEAHTLSEEILEQIRLLSNIELPEKKLIDILFVGQPELNRIITSPACRSLRQRIVLAYHIKPLSRSETRQYIKHRLMVSGADRELFNRRAIHEIHRLSTGYPRLINIICDQALLTGYVRELTNITPGVIRECHQALLLPGERKTTALSSFPAHPGGKRKRGIYLQEIAARLKHQRLLYGAVAASVVIVAVLLTLLAQEDLFSKSDQQGFSPPATTAPSSPRSESVFHQTDLNKAAHIASGHSTEAHLAVNSETPKPTVLDLAQEALEEKDFARALELLENPAARRSVDIPEASVLYAAALRGQAETVWVKDPQKAEVLLRKSLQADPQDARTYFELGKIYTKSKDYPNAIRAYENAADLNPTFPDTFFNLGFVYSEIKDYKRAEQMFLRVTELEPYYLDKVLFNLAMVQQQQGKKQESIENLKKALTANPGNHRARKHLNQIQDDSEKSR